jgi:D-lactate dehydrogenase
MRQFRDRFEHHLILKVGEPAIPETSAYLERNFPLWAGDYFQCTESEAKAAFLHRFVAAGAAVRYREVHRDQVEDIVALDIALPRNELSWFEKLPEEIRRELHATLYYGHFVCYVFHQDYIVRKGASLTDLKRRLCEIQDARGAKYPAEHNVGHIYEAEDALRDFYRELDPRNRLNPGIGRTSRRRDWEMDVGSDSDGTTVPPDVG